MNGIGHRCNSSQLKCLALLPCDLSLITIHISDWRHFSDFHISQGSVATCLRRGEIFKISLLQIYYRVSQCKKSLNIGSYLVKLWARVWCLVFLTHRVVSTRTEPAKAHAGINFLFRSRQITSRAHMTSRFRVSFNTPTWTNCFLQSVNDRTYWSINESVRLVEIVLICSKHIDRTVWLECFIDCPRDLLTPAVNISTCSMHPLVYRLRQKTGPQIHDHNFSQILTDLRNISTEKFLC